MWPSVSTSDRRASPRTSMTSTEAVVSWAFDGNFMRMKAQHTEYVFIRARNSSGARGNGVNNSFSTREVRQKPVDMSCSWSWARC